MTSVQTHITAMLTLKKYIIVTSQYWKNDSHHITVVNMSYTDAIVACWTLALSLVKKNIVTVAPQYRTYTVIWEYGGTGQWSGQRKCLRIRLY